MVDRFPLPGRSDNVSHWLESAAQLFRGTLLKCLPLAMTAVLVSQLASLYWIGTGHKLDNKVPHDATYWVLFVLGLAAYLLCAAALLMRQQSLRAGQEVPPFLRQLQLAMPRWLPLLLASLAGAVLVMVGLVALIVPGIWLAVCLLPLSVVAVLEPVEPLGAIRRSIALVRPLWVKVFASVVIAALVALVCIITAAIVIGLAVAVFAERDTPTSTALVSACMLVIQAVALSFFSALSLTIYSAASSSA